MTLVEIAALANGITDENYSNILILGYVNRCIAKINATLDAKLPMITSVDVAYTALNADWIMLLFVSYAAYSIKANDGSLNEADRFKNEFEQNFRLLEENRFKAIASAYRGEQFGGIYQMDTSVGMNVGWFKSRSTDWWEG